MRRAQQSAFANPVMVGAVTVLVTMVAVFLAYNANQGLPFVPTKQLKVDIADGSSLVPGNVVREGGYLVGTVTDMKPIELPSGAVGAQLTLQLNEKNGNVPVDSKVSIRPVSVLGLKYVDLEKGSSKKMIPDGGTMPIAQTSVPVQFDDLNKMFDAPTRVAVQQNLVGFGDTFAARGSSLNDTIAALPNLLRYLQPVAAYLSNPNTQLTRFFSALNGFTGTVAPVAQTNVQFFADQATTYAAIDNSPADLQATIRESPPTLQVSTTSLAAQQPFLTDLATLGHYMTPATAALKSALPQLNPALVAGAEVLPRTPPLNTDLQHVLSTLKSVSLAPGTNTGLNALTATVRTLNPMVRYLGPFQTVCDSWDYWWTFLAEHISEATTFGYAQRALLNVANHQNNNVGMQGATAPANGYAPEPDQPDAEYLHGPTYGAAVDNSGNADCEIGQRGYVKKLNYFDPQGRNLDSDPHTPGNQGPTFQSIKNGRYRVPKGETYSRNPTTGPQLPYNPTNP